MLVGSYSSNFYGIPRSTKDADLVFQFDSRSLSEIAKRLPEGLSFDQQSTFEMVTAIRKEVILIEGSEFQIKTKGRLGGCNLPTAIRCGLRR